MSDDDFDLSLSTLKYFFNAYQLALWVPPLALAALLRTITHKYHHQLIFPLCESFLFLGNLVWLENSLKRIYLDFLAIPIIFYIVVAAAHLDLTTLRKSGWLFDMDTSDEPWYRFYTFFGKGSPL